MDLIDAYKKDCQLRNFTAKSIYNYSYVTAAYYKFLKDREKDILKGDKEDLKLYLNYLREKGHASRTIDHYFKAIHSFYEFQIESGKMDSNPVDHVRKRYLKKYKSEPTSRRTAISIKDASRLVNSITSTRDKTILLILLKTGIRIHELEELDKTDLDLDNYKIRLKPTPKRSNRIVFFDDETAEQLKLWLEVREPRCEGNPALFVGPPGRRINQKSIGRRLKFYATKLGLHDPSSKNLEDRFTPHCCRHWFTTHLIRSGMPRDFVKELRGDVRRDAIDLYNHIDEKELKESYFAHIPQLEI